jgi:hypothetical protein
MGSDLSKIFIDVETIPDDFGGFVQVCEYRRLRSGYFLLLSFFLSFGLMGKRKGKCGVRESGGQQCQKKKKKK